MHHHQSIVEERQEVLEELIRIMRLLEAACAQWVLDARTKGSGRRRWALATYFMTWYTRVLIWEWQLLCNPPSRWDRVLPPTPEELDAYIGELEDLADQYGRALAAAGRKAKKRYGSVCDALEAADRKLREASANRDHQLDAATGDAARAVLGLFLPTAYRCFFGWGGRQPGAQAQLQAYCYAEAGVLFPSETIGTAQQRFSRDCLEPFFAAEDVLPGVRRLLSTYTGRTRAKSDRPAAPASEPARRKRPAGRTPDLEPKQGA